MKQHIIPTLVITLIIVGFFLKLFYPIPQVYYTPGFGRSDIWSFNYPLKDFLSTSIKNGHLPFWSKNIGTGFPVFAESQIGTFYLPNLLLFGFLPTWLAFNLSYALSFMISFLGMYALLIRNQLGRLSSLLAGFAFSFSGFFISHIHHTNLIQSAALMPWIFLSAELLWQKPTRKTFIMFILILSQQLFAGFPQSTFITLIGIGLYAGATSWFHSKEAPLTKAVILLLAITTAGLVAAPQLIPTLQLTTISNRQFGFTLGEVTRFPYPVHNLITFIAPNYFGTPADGSYPPYNENWGIYWENTAYVGIIPILLIVPIFVKMKKKPLEKSMMVVMLASLTLVLGKNSPLFPLFLTPIFNSFRVPSRFLLLTTFSITALAGISLNEFEKRIEKKSKNTIISLSLLSLIIVISILDLGTFGYNFQPTVPVATALTPPKTVQVVKESRIYLDPELIARWNKEFRKSGWSNIQPFLNFKNGLYENLNLIFNVSQINVYSAMAPLRQSLYADLRNTKLLNASAARYIIRLTPLSFSNQYSLKSTIEPNIPSAPTYYIYENLENLDRVRFAQEYKVAKTTEEFINIINQPEFSFNTTAVLEKDIGEIPKGLTEKQIEIREDLDQRLLIHTSTNQKTLLIVADSFYPGWRATIDGIKTEIFPANINQRAIIIPSGSHMIKMEYVPRTFYLGLLISITTIIGLLVIPLDQLLAESKKKE